MHTKININIKFFSNIHKDLGLSDYNPGTGIYIDVKSGTNIKKLLKTFGIIEISEIIIFRDMERIGMRKKLRDGDTITCLKISGGG